MLCGGAVLAAVGLVTPVRNWIAFHDPLWPVSFDSARLGLHFKGLISLKDVTSDGPFGDAYGVPQGGTDDVLAHGYGYAVAWVVVPLGLLAMGLGVLVRGRDLLRRRGRSGPAGLGLVLLAVVLCMLTAPTFSSRSARYDLHIVAGLMALGTWLLARPRWARAREGLLAAAIVLSLIPLRWMKGWCWYWVSTKHLEDVARHPLASRKVLARPEFDLLGRQREEELHRGDLVVFDDDVDFIGALWNFEMSNRLEYVHYTSKGAFLATVRRLHPTWVVVGADSDARKALEGSPHWALVGTVTPDTDAAFRRSSAAPAIATAPASARLPAPRRARRSPAR